MPPTGSPVAARADELEARTRSFVREHRLPGAAVGVVHADELVWTKSTPSRPTRAGHALRAICSPTAAAHTFAISPIAP